MSAETLGIAPTRKGKDPLRPLYSESIDQHFRFGLCMNFTETYLLNTSKQCITSLQLSRLAEYMTRVETLYIWQIIPSHLI